MFIVVLALSVLVGLSLGLLGGGGSILTVPILRYVLGMQAHEAIVLSLLVVGTTSAAALVPHARKGRVRWRTGLTFGLAGMVGAYGAGRVAHLVPAGVLLTGFGVMMFATAIAMLRKGKAVCVQEPAAPPRELPVGKVLAEGVVVGAVTGLVGAGGGFLVVPALVLLGGLPVELAVGTSLVVITMKSLAGLAGFLGHTAIDWSLGLSIAGAAVVGSVLGSLLLARISGAALRAAFGWFVVSMAFFILAQEVPALLGRERSLPLAVAVSVLGTLGFSLVRRLLARGAAATAGAGALPGANPSVVSGLSPMERPDLPEEHAMKPRVQSFFDARTYTLSYVVWDPESRDAVVIDPVLDYDPAGSFTFTESIDQLAQFVRQHELTLHFSLETHAHADHLSGGQLLRRQFGAKVAIGSRIVEVQDTFRTVFDIKGLNADGSQFDRLLQPGETFHAGTLAIEVLPTPGHTPACVTYKIGDAIFTGDVLFMDDYGTGRCDFPRGSAEAMYDSVKSLYALPDATRVFVGHDYMPGGREVRYETTIGCEKARNPQLSEQTTKAEFVALRNARDAELAAPKLLFQSVQVNVEAGRLPSAHDNGVRYMTIPINFGKQADDLGRRVADPARTRG